MELQESEIVRDIVACVNFAAIKHRNQRRKDPQKTPYINHPLGVAKILTEEAGITDFATIQAAILHDTVEDTNTTFSEIREKFGSEVCSIVEEVTDDKSLSSEERKRLQVVNANKSSLKAKLVKEADKLYNLRDLCRATPEGWSLERVRAYFKWAFEVINELRGTNSQMEKALDAIFMQQGLLRKCD